MGYNSSTGIVTAPVSVADVGSALGSNSVDVGTLCQYPSIKKWAKYKPMVYNTPAELTDAQRCDLDNWGLTNIPYFIRAADMAAFMSIGKPAPSNGAKTGYFLWDRPGDSDWKRLTDFVSKEEGKTKGYYAFASAPINPPMANEITVPPSTSTSVTVEFPLGENNDLCIRLSDFDLGSSAIPNLTTTNMHLGLCIVSKADSSKSWAVTQSTYTTAVMTNLAKFSIAGSTFQNIFSSSSGLLDKSYTVFPFMTNASQTTFAAAANMSSSASTYVPLTFAAKDMVISKMPVLTERTISAYLNSGNTRQFNYNYSVKNKSAGNISISKLEIKTYYDSTLQSAATAQVITTATTVYTGATKSGSGAITLTSASYVTSPLTKVVMEVTIEGIVYTASCNIHQSTTPPMPE